MSGGHRDWFIWGQYTHERFKRAPRVSTCVSIDLKLEVRQAAHGANILNGIGRTPKSYDMINLPSRGIGGIVKMINDKYHVRTFWTGDFRISSTGIKYISFSSL
jgi:hypothetical protein